MSDAEHSIESLENQLKVAREVRHNRDDLFMDTLRKRDEKLFSANAKITELTDKQRFHEIELHNANLGKRDQIELIDRQDAKIAELENRWNNLLSSCGCEERNFATILHELRQQNLELTSKVEKLTGYLAHEATLNLDLEATVEALRSNGKKLTRYLATRDDDTCVGLTATMPPEVLEDFDNALSLTPSSAICRECSGKGQGAAQDSIWSCAPFSCPKCNGTGKVQLPPSSALLAHDLELAERAFTEGHVEGYGDGCSTREPNIKGDFLSSQTRRSLTEGKEKA